MSQPDEFNNECLQAHNAYRCDHQVGPLTYADDLAKSSQEWANYLASINAMKHSDTQGEYGENLASKTSTSSSFVYTGQQVTDKWYSEIEMYDFNGPENQMKCGHFSQVVWKDTKEAGFARAISESGKVFAVGQYRPAGNYMDEWHENVLPSLGGYKPISAASQPNPSNKDEDIKKSEVAEPVDGEDILISKKKNTTKMDNSVTIVITKVYQKKNGEQYTIVKTEHL